MTPCILVRGCQKLGGTDCYILGGLLDQIWKSIAYKEDGKEPGQSGRSGLTAADQGQQWPIRANSGRSGSTVAEQGQQ
jgi:hypothetical protein